MHRASAYSYLPGRESCHVGMIPLEHSPFQFRPVVAGWQWAVLFLPFCAATTVSLPTERLDAANQDKLAVYKPLIAILSFDIESGWTVQILGAWSSMAD